MTETIQSIPLDELHDFPSHPFGVRDDDAMQQTVESIREYGVLVPAIVRPREDGGYEIIAGHRRKHACQLAGLKTMPVIVRDVDRNAATIIMVDSNLQRENILPSEKAKAYKMKLEAIKRQAGRPSKNSVQVGQNYEGKTSREIIAENSPDIKTSIRTKTRIAQLTESGLYTGGSVPYGYRLVKQGRINKRNREVFDLAINEDEAAVVRLIFQKYVHEGFGAQRLCRYLHENGYTRSDGRGFPNTTINLILKNPLYTGVLKNGDTCSPCMEELRIIDRDTFDQAQFIMKERTQPHSTVPLNCKSAALLVGRVYCAHCGNRLTLSTSGHKKRMEDGSTANVVRSRYQCHYQVRHPGQCDGQSVYSVEKLDRIVDQAVRRTLSGFAAMPEAELVGAQQQTELKLQQAKRASTEGTIRDAKDELADYRAEAIRVIRGESSLSADLLNSLIAEGEQRLHALEMTLAAETAAMQDLTSAAQKIQNEYDRLIGWAELYEGCSRDAKKMIIGQLVKAIYVLRGYKIRIEFNISFESFRSYTPHPAKLRQRTKNEPMPVLTSALTL